MIRARLAVSRDGERIGTLAAGKNRYFAEQQTSNEVAIRSDLLRAEDLFVIADQFNPDGSVFLKVLVNPLVNLIWLAGLVFLLGSLIAMWPDAREQRRLAGRFQEAAAPAPARAATERTSGQATSRPSSCRRCSTRPTGSSSPRTTPRSTPATRTSSPPSGTQATGRPGSPS